MPSRDPTSLDAERTRRRGRPLTPHGILDQAALALIDAHGELMEAAAAHQRADRYLRELRATMKEAA